MASHPTTGRKKKGALPILDGEAGTHTGLMFDGLDGSLELGAILTVTGEDGTALQVFCFDEL